MDAQSLDVTFTNLSQLSRAYGAPAVEMAEKVLQRSAQGQIFVGLGLLAGAGVLALTATRLGISFRRADDCGNEGALVGCLFGCIFTVLGTIGATIGGFLMVSDIWAWTALTDPALALAHKVFGSMGG